MAKINIIDANKKLNSNSFYIDSAKFVVDATVFSSVSIPNEFLKVVKDTGEVLEDFKENSLKLSFNGHNYRIGHYRKILRGVVYDKFVIMMSSKVAKRYFKGIQYEDIKNVLIHTKKLGYIDFKDVDKIIREIRLKDVDITFNKVILKEDMEPVIEQFKTLQRSSNRKHLITVFNKPQNKGFQFNNRHKKNFFKIYNKSLEIQNDINEIDLTDIERSILNEYEVMRFEFTVRNKNDFDIFNIDNKFVNLLDELKNKKRISSIVKSYYEYMMGKYKPSQKRSSDDLTPTELSYLSLLSELKNIGRDVYQMSAVFLSPFDRLKDKKVKYRMKQKFYKIMDVLYSNKENISEKNMSAMRGYSFIKEMFFI